MVRRKVKLLANVFQYVELLKWRRLHVRKGELLSCKRGIAQGKSPHGLKRYTLQSTLLLIYFDFKSSFSKFV